MKIYSGTTRCLLKNEHLVVHTNLNLCLRYLFITALLFYGLADAWAKQLSEQGSVKITVINDGGVLLEGAIVELSGTGKTGLTDSAGVILFKNLDYGTYQVQVSHMGFNMGSTLVTVSTPTMVELKVGLKTRDEQLNEVVIAGKSENQQAKEQTIRSAVVSTREVADQPVTLTELINQTAGVRIRQAGGLGAAPDISVSGFQGRSIRYFKDGVPLDYLRDGYNVASVPVNLLERVEIFKGVLPVALGADALGGAVNLISRKMTKPELNFSYEIASFNTHRLTFNGFYTDRRARWIAGVEAFYNHSDNDYKANVKVTDPVTKNQNIQSMRLFHNAFSGYYTEAFAGVVNRRWADELRLSVAGFAVNRQQQHPALMTDPYGAITGRQSSVVPSLRYTKSLLQDKIRISQFAVFNTVTINRVDTLHGQYDWYGNFTEDLSRTGESRQASLSAIRFRNFISRTNLSYQLDGRNKLEVNYVYASSRRTGKDPYGTRFSGTETDILTVPALYNKQVVSAGLETTFFSEKLTNNLMGKFYHFSSEGVEAWEARAIDQNETVRQSGQYWGAAEAAKFQLSGQSFLRMSAEFANRMPEQEELFGDGVWVVPNFNLQPERSLNLNLGYYLRRPSLFSLEINTFYRRTKDMILLVPTQAPYAQYMNMENVKGYGLEADASLHFLRHFVVNGNFTWQSLRLFGLTSSQDLWKNGARLRNTPYFFANAGLAANFSGLIRPKDRLHLYARYNFIREFYLETIPRSVEAKGFLGLEGSASIQSELIIPSQHLLNAGFTYQPSDRYALGLEVKNITDGNLYDYFRIQKAVRSFHLKLNYTLK